MSENRNYSQWLSKKLFLANFGFYATIGAVRTLTQLFAYEVPFFIALLTPAMLTGSWKIADIAAYGWKGGPIAVLAYIVAFGVLTAVGIVGLDQRSRPR